MRNTHSFSFRSKQYDFEAEEDYKEKYIAEEEEMMKQKQKISQYAANSIKLVKEMDNNEEEEQNFFAIEKKKKKKKNDSTITQSKADIESRKIKYPIYSSPILPYSSPNKIKSPSKRFQASMSFLDQELTKQNFFNTGISNLTDSEADIFDFSDDISSTNQI